MNLFSISDFNPENYKKHLILTIVLTMHAVLIAQPLSLRVLITGIQPPGDTVRVLLWKGEKGFPREKEYCFRKKSSRATSDTALIIFNHLEPGDYAVSCFYDENNNRKYDRSFFRQTAEPFGLSGHPDYKHLPVAYQDAHFIVKKDKQRIEIPLHYTKEARNLLK